MRLIHYLNEENDNTIDVIKRECKPFLNEFGKCYKNRNFIYRGMKRGIPGKIELKVVRKDRRPKIIRKELHEYLSKISKELFGWDIRSEGAFTADSFIASRFGKVGIFIPIGIYKYVYVDLTKSDIYSLYDGYSDHMDARKNWKHHKKSKYWEGREEDIKKKDKMIEDDEKHYLERIYKEYKNNYKNDGLSKLLGGSRQHIFESIFRCDKYFIITAKFYNENIKHIFEEL